MDLTDYTQIELLKYSNDIRSEHESLKQEIIKDLLTVEELQNKINENLKILEDLKTLNSLIHEELDNR